MTLDLRDKNHDKTYYSLTFSLKPGICGRKAFYINKNIDMLILDKIYVDSHFKQILPGNIPVNCFISGLVAEVDFSRVNNALLYMEI